MYINYTGGTLANLSRFLLKQQIIMQSCPAAKEAKVSVMLMDNLVGLLLYHMRIFYSKYNLDIKL